MLDSFHPPARLNNGPRRALAAKTNDSAILRFETLEPRLVLSAAPVAAPDVVLVTTDSSVEIDYLVLNDTDADGDSLRVLSTTQPAHGTLADLGSGSYSYTPKPGYAGVDNFMYTVTDGEGKTDSALVEISVNRALDAEAARDAILAGVTAIHGGIQPGRLTAYGPQAYVVSHYPEGVGEGALIAVASWGDGRIVAASDFQTLEMGLWGSQGDSATFYANGLAWLTETTSKDIEIVTFEPATTNWLQGQGYTNAVTISRTANFATALAGKDVVVGWMGPTQTQVNQNAMANFVRNGGGFFAAEYGDGYTFWWNRPIYEAPGNELLRQAGIGWPSGTRFDPDLVNATHRADGQVNADAAIAILADPNNYTLSERTEAATLAAAILDALPETDSLHARLKTSLLTAASTINPTPATPVGSAYEKAILRAEMNLLRDLPPDKVTAHRTAEDVYGAIPEGASRVYRSVTIDTGVSRWIATGLYAAPGEVVTITVPSSLVRQGYHVQLSGHVDDLVFQPTWNRVPHSVARAFRIDATTIEVASAFGGAIYIDLGASPPGLGNLGVTIEGAIEAPHFVRGETTNADWVDSIRDHPAPYAELVSNHVAMSVPSAFIRNLDDPTALMTYWDNVVAFQDYVAAVEHLRTGPERINVDAQISLGSLHAGYPIQGPTVFSQVLVDLPKLTTIGDWGYFHELGHEMQRRPDKAWGNDNFYTFPGDIEVTVNIFANAALEHAVPDLQSSFGFNYSAHPERVMSLARAAVNNPSAPSFEAKDPYPFYFQLADGFGWDAYRAVFTTYHDDYANNPGDLPGIGAQEEKDQWLIRWSEVTGFNLVEYMVNQWGLEASTAAINQVHSLGLPSWMPLLTRLEDIWVAPNDSQLINLGGAGLSLDGAATLVNVGQPTHGTLTPETDGNYTYRPHAGYTGNDTFTATYRSSAGNVETFNVHVDVSDGLSSRWKFDESAGTTAADTGPVGAQATIRGATWTDGYLGGALQFDGVDDSVDAGPQAALAGKTDFTITAWIRTTDSGRIIQQAGGGGGGYYFDVNGNGTLRFRLFEDGISQIRIDSPQTVNDGQWHHVAAQRAGDEGRVYIDGKLAATDAGALTSLDGANPVVVGADTRSNSRFLEGTIDDVRIYSAAIDVSATLPSADFDKSGAIDGIDFLSWQRGFGAIDATLEQGDSDGDAQVDHVDLGFWKRMLGATIPGLAAKPIPSPAARPRATGERSDSHDEVFSTSDEPSPPVARLVDPFVRPTHSALDDSTTASQRRRQEGVLADLDDAFSRLAGD